MIFIILASLGFISVFICAFYYEIKDNKFKNKK
jgi:hypothetical protein